ncbi:hypothetical protein [Nocardia fluminea]|uniref:hypothetical protein n=1 Tax=Nocardia fluminea TaxID=134984 RepID=UPI003D13B285
MAEFRINNGYGDARTVEAHHFREVESLVIFYADGSLKPEQVFAMPTKSVVSIERTAPAK